MEGQSKEHSVSAMKADLDEKHSQCLKPKGAWDLETLPIKKANLKN